MHLASAFYEKGKGTAAPASSAWRDLNDEEKKPEGGRKRGRRGAAAGLYMAVILGT